MAGRTTAAVLRLDVRFQPGLPNMQRQPRHGNRLEGDRE